MAPSIHSQLVGKISLILICGALGACASTQKSSSTGAGGEQAAAPVTDASQPKSGAKPGGSQSGTGSTGTSSSSSGTSGAAGTSPSAAGKPAGGAGSSASKSDNEEAAQLKKQLEDQDAQINRLRNDQQANAAREEAEAAKAMQDQSSSSSSSAGQSAAAGAAAAKAGNDEAAVFPDNGNARQDAAGGGSDAAVPETAERSIYFAYDQASVPDKYDDMLLANAAYLKAHPALKSEVQGNCDERGSREYNLALGARRAEAVKRALELAGADGSRINAISFGAEKPVAMGKDEESYSKNRRADIVY